MNLNVNELLNSNGEEMNGNLDNMNLDVSLNYDNNPEMMSSEFFDSVLSLENNLEDSFFTFNDELHLSASDYSNTTDRDTDELLSPQSMYSESERSSSSDSVDEPGTMLSGVDNVMLSILDSDMDTIDPIENALEAQFVGVPNVMTTPTKATKILIQNPNNKKMITKPLIHTTQFKKSFKGKSPQILKVQSVSNNGRQVLLPLNVKSIKILNSNMELASLRSIHQIEAVPSVTDEDEDINVVSSSDGQYSSNLSLTSEEKRLLAKEGIHLPTQHPLTKTEERELKRIRRKIRNKISAQDSRKRKKEYVDGLEERVKRGSEENKNLMQRVRELQRQNKNLIAHVNKLQALICKSTTTRATPSTCLMVVLLSALLVSLPNIRLFENKQISPEQEQVAIRRSLLSSQQATEDDAALNMEEFLLFKDDDAEFEGKDVLDIENATEKEFSKLLEDMGNKYDEKNSSEKHSIFSKVIASVKSFLDKDKEKPPLFASSAYKGYHNGKGFVEPDIDDDPGDEPMMKRMRFSDRASDENFISTTTTVNAGMIASSKNK